MRRDLAADTVALFGNEVHVLTREPEKAIDREEFQGAELRLKVSKLNQLWKTSLYPSGPEERG
jgi:hypothetical protein